MRIATNTIYTAGLSRLSEIQSSIVKTQQQISTGRRILSPSDDPIGAARALDLTQGQTMNTQFGTNRQSATNSLSMEESVLQGSTSLLQDVKALTISAGNGVLTDAERKFIATDLRGRLDELIGQANSTDGACSYLFAGFNVTTPPFSSAATGAQYTGDQGQRLSQVGTSRQMAMSDAGDSVFQNVRNSGVQKAVADPANTGALTPSRIMANGSAPLTGNDYEISFTSATSYSVVNKATGATVLTEPAYAAGQPISFDGMQLTVAGTPVAGDKLAVVTPRNQSVFTTMSDLITALETPVVGAAGKADLQRSLSAANGNIDNALENILTVRASIGSRLKEIDSLNTSGEDRNFQFAQALAQIQEVDYTKAISDFNQQNANLEAAQKTFLKVSGLSLFNLL